MIMLGIILMLVAIILGLGGLWMMSSANAVLQIHSGPFEFGASAIALLIFGMATVALLWLGAWLAGFGTKRSIGKRRERKQLERDAREHERALAETQAKLGHEREQSAAAERAREEERLRESKLRVEADRRRESGRENEVREAALEREMQRGHAAPGVDDGGSTRR